MADFHFLTADPTKGILGDSNAMRYELYRWRGELANIDKDEELQKDSNWALVDVQNKIQTFGINGAMTSSGKPYEDKFDIPFDGTATSYEFPITEETPNGLSGYFRVSCKITVVSNGKIFSGVTANGKFSVSVGRKYSFKTQQLVVDYNGDYGIFAKINVTPKDGSSYEKYVKVFDLDVGHKVSSALFESVSISRALLNFNRTTYIPISCLTDSVEPEQNGCVGYYSKRASNDNVFRILFFNNKLEFVKGLTYEQIIKELGYVDDAEIGWINVSQINQLATTGDIEYVVFVSKQLNTDPALETDGVSIGNIYFPLFNMIDGYFKDGNTTPTTSPYLSVRSIGDGLFFSDSEYSKPKKYERVFRT